MGGQLAKLYLRGKLMTTTAKELPPEDLEQLQRLMKQAWECPLLRNAKVEFCMALARTIGNEYKDRDIGMQDAQITFWRTALMVLYHNSKRCIRCKHSYTTTFDDVSHCTRILKNWCDQGQKKPHGTIKPVSITTKWLQSNNDYTVSDDQKHIIKKIQNDELHRAKACPKCLKRKQLHFVYDDDECGGELKETWSPKQEIATEATFQCRCGEIWKTHHNGDPIKEECKCGREVIGEYIKRKKFFQTYLFNYLKQILRENKPPQVVDEVNIVSPVDEVLRDMVCDIFNSCKDAQIVYDVSSDNTGHHVHTNLGLLPQTVILQLRKLRRDFENAGVNMVINSNSITISANNEQDGMRKLITRSMINKAFVKFVSMHGNNDDDDNNSFNDYCEFKANPDIEVRNEQVIDELDRIDMIRGRLPETAQQVLDIIVNTPDGYYRKYSTDKIHKAHIMDYLGISQSEVDNAYSTIKMQLLAEGVQPF